VTKSVLIGILLFAGSALAIGPVGQYLGYQLNTQAVSSGRAKDSIHLTLPTPTDTVVNLTSVDTTILDSEFPFRGLTGYRLTHYTWTGDSLLLTPDTAYESAGVWLKQRQAVGESLLSVMRYQVPFVVDSSWRTGSEGVYPVDFAHNDTVDTVSIWADTARVDGREDVTTPYGTVTNCYRIVTTSHWCVVTWIGGIPTRDSMIITDYQWYKDSLWQVKDSAYSLGQIRIKVLTFWLPAGTVTTCGVNELVSLGPTAVQDESSRTRSAHSSPFAWPNPFRIGCTIEPAGASSARPARIEIFDVTGRTVFAARVKDRIVWRPEGLPGGVYGLVIRGTGGRTVLGRLVYTH
jgi:hypothetical protein